MVSQCRGSWLLYPLRTVRAARVRPPAVPPRVSEDRTVTVICSYRDAPLGSFWCRARCRAPATVLLSTPPRSVALGEHPYPPPPSSRIAPLLGCPRPSPAGPLCAAGILAASLPPRQSRPLPLAQTCGASPGGGRHGGSTCGGLTRPAKAPRALRRRCRICGLGHLRGGRRRDAACARTVNLLGIPRHDIVFRSDVAPGGMRVYLPLQCSRVSGAVCTPWWAHSTSVAELCSFSHFHRCLLCRERFVWRVPAWILSPALTLILLSLGPPQRARLNPPHQRPLLQFQDAHHRPWRQPPSFHYACRDVW